MKTLTIQQKVYGAIAILSLLVIVSGLVIDHFSSKIAEDVQVVDALGRQRMLTQAMGKAAFGFAMSRGRLKTIEDQTKSLDSYITNMRGTYTKSVIKVAKALKLPISMHPASEPHPAVPFPATFARMVNEKFGKGSDLSVDIISEKPVNPMQSLKTDMDRAANDYLKSNPRKIFTKTFEENGKLLVGMYTADIATVAACANCHTQRMGTPFKVGDMLGIRYYRTVFSDDIAVGKVELNAQLNEYETASKIFTQTLQAAKTGGEFPADLSMKSMKSLEAISDPKIQKKISQIEAKFGEFSQSVRDMVDSEINSNLYRKAQVNILKQSNELRGLSNDLVHIYEHDPNSTYKCNSDSR